MKEVFRFRQSIKAVHSQYKLNLELPKMKHLTFANKSMKCTKCIKCIKA